MNFSSNWLVSCLASALLYNSGSASDVAELRWLTRAAASAAGSGRRKSTWLMRICRMVVGIVETAGGAEALGDPYRPYRSVVAWYCWRAAELYGGAAGRRLRRAR